jgi:hypothetical protein
VKIEIDEIIIILLILQEICWETLVLRWENSTFRRSSLMLHIFLQSSKDPHEHPWANAGFVNDIRGTSTNVLTAPSLSSRRTLIQLHYFSASYAANLLHNFSCFTGELDPLHELDYTSVAVAHLQSLTTGLWPGTGQLTYFRRLSTSNLFALNSVCVIIPKSCPSGAVKCYLDLEVFLFANARWLFDHFQLSKQSVSVTLRTL